MEPSHGPPPARCARHLPRKRGRIGIADIPRPHYRAPMIVFPAIDLKAGQVVRLAEGDMDRATVYGDDPAAQALLFAEAGAMHLHVVDLDGAFAGESRNRAAVEKIVATFPGYVQLGGGIRTAEAVEGWFALGVARVVIGTAALKDPEFVKSAARDLPGRIVVGVDARDGMVATEGWADVSDVRVEDLARRFEDAGVAALLFTDVGRDGLLKGCNVEATVALARAVAIPVIASGGVADIHDIHALRPHVADGIEGVITGRALYDGRLDLAEAIAAGR
jgi:phosphoribosylformimino-5-aminoimidazole carboxamide ribotide isomerase